VILRYLAFPIECLLEPLGFIYIQMPLVKKCYDCKVIEDLTNTKLAALEQEYRNLQHYLQTREDRGLYSANK
jgi:hypothetical protein